MSLDVQTVHYHEQVDFARPGKALYELAFHYDGEWGNAMVPMAVLNGAAGPGPGVVAFGGTPGDEYEGQVAVWRLMHELDLAEHELESWVCGEVALADSGEAGGRVRMVGAHPQR